MSGSVLKLFRLPLALMNGVAAVGGYLLFPAPTDLPAASTVLLGVTLLAASASALNQVMERDLDALMRRTSSRPLPTGVLRPPAALMAGAALLVCGTAALAAGGGAIPALLGLATILWYLAVYTPLKRRSPFALLLGALCGSAAPLIGWSVAGGSLHDFRVILLAGIIYLWQVPHFWLLQRRHAEDYRLAGFAVFEPPGGESAVAPLCRLWIGAMVASALMLPLFGMVRIPPLLCAALLLVYLPLTGMKRCQPLVFAGLNSFPFLVTLALFSGK